MAKKRKTWRELSKRDQNTVIAELGFAEEYFRETALEESFGRKADRTRTANALRAAIEFLQDPEETTTKEVT